MPSLTSSAQTQSAAVQSSIYLAVERWRIMKFESATNVRHAPKYCRLMVCHHGVGSQNSAEKQPWPQLNCLWKLCRNCLRKVLRVPCVKPLSLCHTQQTSGPPVRIIFLTVAVLQQPASHGQVHVTGCNLAAGYKLLERHTIGRSQLQAL